LSKTFNATEQNYPIYDWELFALIRALKEWRVLLEGAPHTITVYSDHENLKYFWSAQDLNRRQFRWSMYISRFPINLEHQPDKTMILSDILSRRADQEEQGHKSTHDTPIWRYLCQSIGYRIRFRLKHSGHRTIQFWNHRTSYESSRRKRKKEINRSCSTKEEDMYQRTTILNGLFYRNTTIIWPLDTLEHKRSFGNLVKTTGGQECQPT
jgi:hypothetical protein